MYDAIDVSTFIPLPLSISFLKTRGEKWQVWKVYEAWKREGAIFQFASRKKETSKENLLRLQEFSSRGCTLARKAAKREVYSAKLSRGPPRVHAEYANNIIFLTFLSLNSLPSPFLPGENTDKFLFSRAARLLSVGTLSSVIIKLLLRFYYIARTIVEDEKLNEL